MLIKLPYDINCDEPRCLRLARWTVQTRDITIGKYCTPHAEARVSYERTVSEHGKTTRPDPAP